MSFTTPCFIRINTPELRKKLHQIGLRLYLLNPNAKHLLVDSGDYMAVGIKRISINIAIDCGTNEQSFLSLAALRDDSDYMQWFTDGVNWVLCTSNRFGVYWSMHECVISLDTAHKATVEELIEHFKNKEQ